MPRRASDGSIRESKDRKGVYEVRVSYGTDPVTGKPRRAWRTVHGTITQARKVRDDLRRELETGLAFDAHKTTFAAFAREFENRRLEQGRVNRKDGVRDARLVTLLCEQVGDVRVIDLDAGTCERALEKLHEAHPELSNNYRRMIFAKLKQVMSDAVMHDLITRNPCDKLKPPKRTEPTRKSFTPEDFGRLMVALDGEGDSCAPAMAVRLAAATGMRHGEILALDWGAVELDDRRLRVVASLTIYNELKAPKSKAGTRALALDAGTVAHLKAYKIAQSEMLAGWSIKQSETTPVITTETGTRYDYANLSRWVRIFFDSHNLSGYVLHELRHTQATFLLAANTDVKTVQARLGHSQAALTLDLYGHAMPERDRGAADTIAALIFAAQKQASEGDEEKRLAVDLRSKSQKQKARKKRSRPDTGSDLRFCLEPTSGFEPLTCALRVRCSTS